MSLGTAWLNKMSLLMTSATFLSSFITQYGTKNNNEQKDINSIVLFLAGDASYHGGSMPDIHMFDYDFKHITSVTDNEWVYPLAHPYDETMKFKKFNMGYYLAQYMQLNGRTDGICIAGIGYKIQGRSTGGLIGDMWRDCGGFLSDVTNIRIRGESIKCGYLSKKNGTPDQIRFALHQFHPYFLETSKNKSESLCAPEYFETWNTKIADNFINTPFNSSKIRIFQCPSYYREGEDRALTACTDQNISGASLVDECHRTFCDMSSRTYYNLTEEKHLELGYLLYNDKKYDRDFIDEMIVTNYVNNDVKRLSDF